MTTTKTLAEMTPVEIDTELARLYGERDDAAIRRHDYEGYVAAVNRKANPAPWDLRDRDEYEAKIAELTRTIAALTDEMKPYNEEFVRRGGWFRYYLVTNGNGHVHREMTCHTCYPTTRYAWLVGLADCDEAAMIEEWGERACTVCFPDAPVNPLYHRPARVDREERERREAEKAAKLAEKNAKAITAPDGGSLRVPDGTYKNYRTGEIEMSYETIKTKVAASRALTAAIKDYGWYGPTHPSMFGEKIPVLIEALEAAGIETAPIIARAKKASAKDGARYVWNG